MPVKGTNTVKRNMRQTFKDISEKKAHQFVTTVLSIGYTASLEHAPIEYSNLINSVTMMTDTSAGRTSGEVRYNASYAAYLEFNETWKPRPVGMKDGPAWNPNAKPHFLRDGFESSESQAAIKRATEIFRL